MKVATLNNISGVGLNLLPKTAEFVDNPEDAEIILVRSHDMHEMAIHDHLLGVGRAGAGVNNIPIKKMAEKGVIVFNAPGGNANGVKELLIAGLIMANRHVLGGIEWVKENAGSETIQKDMEKAKKKYAGTEIIDKTIGVIGLGHVGGRVAKACFTLGMKVIGYDPYLSDEQRRELPEPVALTTDLGEIYAKSDYISLHLPLLDSTRHMMDEDVFAKCKEGVILLNYARAGLVDDDALKEAIDKGIVATYVTDFPNQKTSAMKNVIAFPHLGATTKESTDNCAIMAIKQLLDYKENGTIKHAVNFPDLDAPDKKPDARLVILHHDNDDLLDTATRMIKDHVKDLKIQNLLNKTQGDFGATIIDCDKKVDDNLKEKLMGIDAVIRVRIL